jgi:hypothetical protein
MPENQPSLIDQTACGTFFRLQLATMDRRSPAQQQLSLVDMWQMLVRRRAAILGLLQQ